MKKLTDVYIKVTKQNKDILKCILTINTISVGDVITFLEDNINSWSYERQSKGLKKVSLSQLKRLIDTIPTREEIVRLKRQISAYKTNYDKVVKHSLSKENVIEGLRSNNERLNNINITLRQTNDYLYDKTDTLLKENKQLKQRKWWQIWK